MPARPKFETCAKIDLSLLIENGVLDADHREMVGFKSGEVPMVFLYIPPWPYPKREPELLVEFEVDELVLVQRIAMGFTSTKVGKQPYLVCPASGARCNELFLHQYRFISRRKHPRLAAKKAPPAHRREVKLIRARDRVLGTVGRPPARGEERSRLIAQLQALPLTQLRWPQLGPHFEAEDRRRQRLRKDASRRSVKQSVNSTELALRRGRRSTGNIDLEAHAAIAPEDWLGRMDLEDRFGDLPLAFVDDHPVLDIRALVKRWSLGKSQLRATIIVWPEVGGFLIADLRDPDRPFLRFADIQKPDGSTLPDLIIRLARSSHGRWYLQCPLTGRSCELLFMRQGYFVSAQAGRLIHRSQRGR